MSLKSKFALIDTRATTAIGDLTIDVMVRDFKQSYGKDRWLVEPVTGSGSTWVEKITPKKRKR